MDKLFCDLRHIVLKATRRLRRVTRVFYCNLFLCFIFLEYFFLFGIAVAALLRRNSCILVILFFISFNIFYSQQFEQVIISCSSNKSLEIFSSHKRQLRVIIYILLLRLIHLAFLLVDLLAHQQGSYLILILLRSLSFTHLPSMKTSKT